MSRPGQHGDGFRWVRGQLSMAAPSHTLIDPDGHQVAHVYQASDRRWYVIDAGTGEVVADHLASAGEALAAADNEYRPCAHVDAHSSHGIVPCDNDRAPGSIYCTPHNC